VACFMLKYLFILAAPQRTHTVALASTTQARPTHLHFSFFSEQDLVVVSQLPENRQNALRPPTAEPTATAVTCDFSRGRLHVRCEGVVH
jgi:hypothetical protein